MTTLDLRGSSGTLRLARNGGTATVRSFLVIGPAGATGPAGPTGPQGPAGNASASGDADTAGFLNNPASATRGALSAVTLGLVQAAKNPDVLVTGAITLNGSDQITSAAVKWPDGAPGTLTITSRDATGSVLAYNITYGSPVTKTFTQPTITRNANGAATNVPAIVVS